MSHKGSKETSLESRQTGNQQLGQTGNQTSENVKKAQDMYKALMIKLANDQAKKDKK